MDKEKTREYNKLDVPVGPNDHYIHNQYNFWRKPDLGDKASAVWTLFSPFGSISWIVGRLQKYNWRLGKFQDRRGFLEHLFPFAQIWGGESYWLLSFQSTFLGTLLRLRLTIRTHSLLSFEHSLMICSLEWYSSIVGASCQCQRRPVDAYYFQQRDRSLFVGRFGTFLFLQLYRLVTCRYWRTVWCRYGNMWRVSCCSFQAL